MNHYQSSDNINYINPLEYMSNSFSQSIHSTMIENKINSSNFLKINPLNRKRKRRNKNKILNRKIKKILKSQKITNKKLECISNILLSKLCNLDLYDYEHFEINIIKNVDDNDEKTIEENPYISYDESKNEELENSQNNDKSKDLENSKEDENENDSQNQNNNSIQNQKNYDNKFSNLEININEFHISSNKIKNKIYEKEENNAYNLKFEKEIENEKINKENININNNDNDKQNILPKKNVEIEEIDNLNINIEKNKENDEISNYSEEKNDIQRKISLSQQSNQSEKQLNSNMIKSSQDRFKKIRGFNFRNNIKNKKSFQQNEKNEINKLLNRGKHDDIPLSFNTKDNI